MISTGEQIRLQASRTGDSPYLERSNTSLGVVPKEGEVAEDC